MQKTLHGNVWLLGIFSNLESNRKECDMKYIVLLGDGMADNPLEELGGRTPLQAADIPSMDRLASEGMIGLVRTIPEGMAPGSDVANLSVMGYDPEKYYTGRAPIEAASIGVALGSRDVAFRCNLVTLSGEPGRGRIMADYSAGHISTADAAQIMACLKSELNRDGFEFFAGVSYRHLMVWRNGLGDMTTTPPHDISGQCIDTCLPEGQGAERIIELMNRAQQMLSACEVNRKRLAEGNSPANAIWLWGQGTSPNIPTFSHKYGINGAVISAVDLVKGLGICAGLSSINVPGATGYLDTNYEGKAEAAIEALKQVDFVYLHVEAPDEASHKGSLTEKIQAIEDFDKRVVKHVISGMEQNFDNFRLMILPDHPTPLSIKTHSSDPVPFILYSSDNNPRQGSVAAGYSEADARKSGVMIENGYELMDRLVKG